jgi:hypothetical protein
MGVLVGGGIDIGAIVYNILVYLISISFVSNV